MARVELTRRIAAPPQRVFAFFVPQRMPYWYGAEIDSYFQVQNGAADFRSGLWVRVAGSLGKENVGHTFVVSEYARPRAFEWRFTDAYGVTGSERWELSPAPRSDADADGAASGGTQLKFTANYKMPGPLGPLVDWLLTRHGVRARHRMYLEKLARFVEPIVKPANVSIKGVR